MVSLDPILPVRRLNVSSLDEHDSDMLTLVLPCIQRRILFPSPATGEWHMPLSLCCDADIRKHRYGNITHSLSDGLDESTKTSRDPALDGWLTSVKLNGVWLIIGTLKSILDAMSHAPSFQVYQLTSDTASTLHSDLIHLIVDLHIVLSACT